ncbi:MAG: hypothetical protein ACR2L1_00275 [Pyrinomonadaceae bacterium]
MKKRDLVKYSGFFVRLEELERQLRALVDLGVHLKAANPGLLKKLDDAAEAINEYFDEEEAERLKHF